MNKRVVSFPVTRKMNPAEISAAPALSHRYETEKLEAEDDEKVLEGAGVLDAGEEAHVKG